MSAPRPPVPLLQLASPAARPPAPAQRRSDPRVVLGGASSSRRNGYLPFAPPLIGEEEIAEVVDTLRSDWITTGPKVARFEALQIEIKRLKEEIESLRKGDRGARGRRR